MHHIANHMLLLVIIDAVHEVLTGKSPHLMRLLMFITVSRKTIAETDHLGTSVGSSKTVYMFHCLDGNIPYYELTYPLFYDNIDKPQHQRHGRSGRPLHHSRSMS